MKKIWVAMAGMRGCMPNVCEDFTSRINAIDFLVKMHDSERGLRSDLMKFDYSERCPGNQYCSVEKQYVNEEDNCE